jgi:acetyl esterase/lipase
VFTPLVSEQRSFGRIVDAGFAVVAADYRLSGEARFPAQVDDVAAALTWIVEHADEHALDASRIVLWGGSAGATLAALVAERLPSGVVGVIAWYGPSNLLEMARFTERKGVDAVGGSREDLWLGAPVLSIPGVATAASPALGVSPGLPPFHLAHGLDDTEVPHEQSEMLAAALHAAGAEVDLHLEPGAGHFWRGASDQATDALFDRAIAFARRVSAPTVT